MQHQAKWMELEERNKASLIWWSSLLISACAIGASLLLTALSEPWTPNRMILLGGGFTFLLAAWSLRWGSNVLSGTLLCLLLCLVVIAVSFSGIGFHAPILKTFILVIVVSAFLVSTRLSTLCLAIALATSVVLVVLHYQGYPFSRVALQPTFLRNKLIADIIIVSLTWWFLWLYERSRQRAWRLAEESLTQTLEAKERAERADRVKSQFLAKVSHELRTPLNAIIGYTELIGEELQSDVPAEELEADLDAISSSARHLLSLINDLLDLSKIEAQQLTLRLEPFTLQQLLEQLQPMIASLAKKNHNHFELLCHVDAGLAMHTDLLRLRQVAFNLCSNACKFTHGGRVSLELSQPREETLRLVVRDTGIGMSEEQLSRIFEPFVQADPEIAHRFGGTGLGLAITQELCQALRGELWAESTPGEGSSFFVELPVVLDEASRGEEGE